MDSSLRSTPRPHSQHVIRFKRDPRSGTASYAAGSREKPEGYQDSGRLLSILATQPKLKNYLDGVKCLGEGGLDIEGLAVRGGRLYFGLRGPTEQGFAFVVSVDTEAFFSTADPQTEVTRVQVGAKRGVRDLATVSDGILVLAGPGDNKANADAGWTLSHWDGKTQGSSDAKPKQLAALNLSGVAKRACDKEIKPEGIALLEETPQHYQLLVLSDGMCDGGALLFKIAR